MQVTEIKRAFAFDPIGDGRDGISRNTVFNHPAAQLTPGSGAKAQLQI